MSDLGKVFMAVGLAIFALGAAMSIIGKVPWLGRLPGDIAIERENFRLYFPLGTCLLLSAGLSLLFWLLRR